MVRAMKITPRLVAELRRSTADPRERGHLSLQRKGRSLTTYSWLKHHDRLLAKMKKALEAAEATPLYDALTTPNDQLDPLDQEAALAAVLLVRRILERELAEWESEL